MTRRDVPPHTAPPPPCITNNNTQYSTGTHKRTPLPLPHPPPLYAPRAMSALCRSPLPTGAAVRWRWHACQMARQDTSNKWRHHSTAAAPPATPSLGQGGQTQTLSHAGRVRDAGQCCRASQAGAVQTTALALPIARCGTAASSHRLSARQSVPSCSGATRPVCSTPQSVHYGHACVIACVISSVHIIFSVTHSVPPTPMITTTSSSIHISITCSTRRLGRLANSSECTNRRLANRRRALESELSVEELPSPGSGCEP